MKLLSSDFAATATSTFTVVFKTSTSIFKAQRFLYRKDIWLRYVLHFYCLFSNTNALMALGYPSPQQEHDLLILNALSRRSAPSNFFPEDTIMEMISQSNIGHLKHLPHNILAQIHIECVNRSYKNRTTSKDNTNLQLITAINQRFRSSHIVHYL